MALTNYFGFICPICSSTVNVGGGEPNCPSCGTRMVANKKGNSVAMNVSCKKCNNFFGMIDSDKCPTCGVPFS